MLVGFWFAVKGRWKGQCSMLTKKTTKYPFSAPRRATCDRGDSPQRDPHVDALPGATLLETKAICERALPDGNVRPCEDDYVARLQFKGASNIFTIVLGVTYKLGYNICYNLCYKLVTRKYSYRQVAKQTYN